MKKKITITEEFGYRWRNVIVKRKEYSYRESVKIAKLRRQTEESDSMVIIP